MDSMQKIKTISKHFENLKQKISISKLNYLEMKSQRKILQGSLINLSKQKNIIINKKRESKTQILNGKTKQSLEDQQAQKKKNLLQFQYSTIIAQIQKQRRRINNLQLKNNQNFENIQKEKNQAQDMFQKYLKEEKSLQSLKLQVESQQKLQRQLNQLLLLRIQIYNQLIRIVQQTEKKLKIEEQIKEQKQRSIKKSTQKLQKRCKHKIDTQINQQEWIGKTHSQKILNQTLKSKLKALKDIQRDHKTINFNIIKIFKDIKLKSTQQKQKEEDMKDYFKKLIKTRLIAEYSTHLICNNFVLN